MKNPITCRYILKEILEMVAPKRFYLVYRKICTNVYSRICFNRDLFLKKMKFENIYVTPPFAYLTVVSPNLYGKQYINTIKTHKYYYLDEKYVQEYYSHSVLFNSNKPTKIKPPNFLKKLFIGNYFISNKDDEAGFIKMVGNLPSGRLTYYT